MRGARGWALIDQVGPYVLGDTLGTGSIGTVYRSVGIDGPVAVKVIHAALADEPGFRTRLLREAELARRVTGAGIVRVVDVDASSARPYLVTEFLDAPTLAERTRTIGPLAGDALHRFASSLADALATVHRAGVIHRDLKPTNVLVAEDGSAYVLDFGIAAGPAQTQPVDSIGTIGWLAPEVAAHGPATAAADVFGWGLVVAYAATGAHPFASGVAPTAQQHAIMGAEPNLWALPDPLRAQVQAALNTRSELRPVFHHPTTSSPGTNSDIAATELPHHSRGPRPRWLRSTRWRWRSWSKRRRWVGIAVAAVLLIGTLIMFNQGRRSLTQAVPVVLYDDAFRNGASLNGFNGHNDPASSAHPHQGAFAIASSLSPPSAVMFIYIPDGNLFASRQALTFWMRSDSGTPETVTISATTSTRISAGGTISVTAEAGRWKSYRIPLARLISDRASFATATERMIWFQVGVAANPSGQLLYDDLAVT